MKKIKLNENTKVLEVIEQDDIEENNELTESIKSYIRETVEENYQINKKGTRNSEKQNKISFGITILSFVISVLALGISYSQKVINEKQTNVNMRRFDLEKQPLFECNIEQEELYNKKEYWEFYQSWLVENDIKIFNEWFQLRFPQKNISHLENDKYQIFWDAYDGNDYETLNIITDGNFKEYNYEYSNYLRSKDYKNFLSWKEDYDYKKSYITIKNTGAPITNASLELYTFLKYQLNIGDDISYLFALDMNNQIINEFWVGTYDVTTNYILENNTFLIEYTQKVHYDENEYLELRKLLNYLSSDDILMEIGLDENDFDVFYVIDNVVYLSINYLDREQTAQTDWYRYSQISNTLDYVETYDSDVRIPDFTKEGFSDAYYEAITLHTAEILGYQNAKWRPIIIMDDYSYLEVAKENIIEDLKKLIKKNDYGK